jgi:hypothetical protein
MKEILLRYLKPLLSFILPEFYFGSKEIPLYEETGLFSQYLRITV